jgi:hypothetical protein
MNTRRIVLTAALLASVAPGVGATSHGADGSDAVTESLSSHDVYLNGPFGRVAGGSLEAPAAAQPGHVALDAFSRSAPLVVDTRKGEPFDAKVSARAISSGDGSTETLSRGNASFEGPAAEGSYVVVVDTRTPAGEASVQAWLLEVPDRDPPQGGLYDIPAPDVVLEASSGSVAGTFGDGCYLYLCADLGYPTPSDQLASLTVTPGEPLQAHLSDGSGILAWDGRLEPLGETKGSPRESIGGLLDPVDDSVSLHGLDGPPPGMWRLRLTIIFDRERGQIESHYRLLSE